MCTVWFCCPPLVLRYGVVAAMSLPCEAEPDHQSASASAYVCVVPSVYTMVPLPEDEPKSLVPMKPNVPPVPVISTAWPPATALSGAPVPAVAGQGNDTPSWTVDCPAVQPAAARAWADRLAPPPSRLPAPGVASSLIAELLKAAVSEAYGTVTGVWELNWAVGVVTVAFRLKAAGSVPSGMATAQVVVACWPAPTSEKVAGSVGVAVHPAGTSSATETFGT